MKKILIGKINSAFGIKGEVKIVSYCKQPTDIEKYQIFDNKGNLLKLKISNKNKAVIGNTADGNAILIAKISGIDDRNKAEEARGSELFTNRDDFKKLSNDDEFYHVDLIGLKVIDADKKPLGKVINVCDFGAGAMLEIEFEQKNVEQKLEKIESFPFKNEFFPTVDVKGGVIVLNLPEIAEMKD